MSQLLGQLSLPDMPQLEHLGRLNSAVAMLHERDVGDVVLQQRRSSVLLSFVDTRLGASDAQLIHQGMPMQIDTATGGGGGMSGWAPMCCSTFSMTLCTYA